MLVLGETFKRQDCGDGVEGAQTPNDLAELSKLKTHHLFLNGHLALVVKDSLNPSDVAHLVFPDGLHLHACDLSIDKSFVTLEWVCRMHHRQYVLALIAGKTYG